MSGYGAHLLHGFQPHFLHHPLNPAVSTASGTSPFGGGGAFVKPFPSNLPLQSAFAPPKCLGFGIDQVSKDSPGRSVPGSEPTRVITTSDVRISFPRDCCLAAVAPVPSPSERRTRPVQRAPRCPHPPRMSPWRDRPAKRATAIGIAVFAVRNEVRKHLASDVSSALLSSIRTPISPGA